MCFVLGYCVGCYTLNASFRIALAVNTEKYGAGLTPREVTLLGYGQ